MDTVLTKVYENRFIPARGAMPAFLEGREDVCKKLRAYIGSTIDGNTPNGIPVILGPTGIGKTAVLRWIEGHAKDEVVPGESLRVSLVSGCTLQSPSDVRRAFSEEIDGEIWRLVWRKIKEKSEIDLLAERRSWENGQCAPNISEAINRQYRKSPNILLVDDAQLIETDAFVSLVQQVETLRRAGVEILLILSGRQGILDLVKTAEMRSPRSKLRIDVFRLRPLEISEVCKVLRSTLALGEIPIRDRALHAVATFTGGHPYLVQFWGNVLWNETRWHHRDRIVEDDVENARQVLSYQIGKTEGFRKREWSKVELSMIRDVKQALENTNELSEKELTEVMIKSGEAAGLDDYESREILERMLQEDIVDRDSLEGGYKEAISMRIEYFIGIEAVPTQAHD